MVMALSIRHAESHLRVVARSVLWTHAIIGSGWWCWKVCGSIQVVARIG